MGTHNHDRDEKGDREATLANSGIQAEVLDQAEVAGQVVGKKDDLVLKATDSAPAAKSHDEGRMVDVVELGRAVKRERERRKMGLRAVADETGVSASTLSRIENGTSNPDADNIARLTKWLKMPMERFMGARDDEQQPIVYFPQEATPDIVEVHLRADRNLTPESASALAELFRVAYQQFSRQEKK